MKNSALIIAIIFFTISCSDSRAKVDGELVLSESVYEENGIYYQHTSNHKKVKYSGKCVFYWHRNGNKKGIAIFENGLPEGHWEYWNEDGSKRLDLYFEEGKLMNKKQ